MTIAADGARTTGRGDPRITLPTLSAPEGGGAVRGLGESFESHAFSGAATLSIPVPATPIRGLGPELAVSYSSAAGNGVFGMGFSLSLSTIGRATNNGIPRYEGDDAFVMDDEGELVPALVWDPAAKRWVADRRAEPAADPVWDVIVYRPRREASCSRIEQWVRRADRTSRWRVWTRDNVVRRYGMTPDARISDPEHPERIFQWLVEEVEDPTGNKIRYRYKAENDVDVPVEIYEQRRDHASNRYISCIEYGNYLVGDEEQFSCRVAFDYGELSIADPDAPPGDWAARSDPFSSYRSGFEIRTMRRCRAILVFHRFHDLFGGEPFLVRSLQFAYEQTPGPAPDGQIAPGMSFLRRVDETGFRKLQDGTYERAALPPLQLSYATFDPLGQTYRQLEVEGHGMLPSYLRPGRYLLVDLEGEGLPGVLLSDQTTTLVWEPLGEGRYAGPTSPATFPVESDLQGAGLALTSLDANGEQDLVVREPRRSGCYRSAGTGSWAPFKPFASAPTELTDSTTQLVDMSGDGRADIAQLGEEWVRVWPSLGLGGYGSPEVAPRGHDFPVTESGDGQELLAFADVFGDGLSHRVMIRDGQVECWPNLGYGKFGEKVLLGDAPHFGAGFDVTRLFLADLDGSGPADLLYAHADRIEVFFNENGNRFSKPSTLLLPCPYDRLSQISFGDVNGNGTTSLILTQIDPSVVHHVYDFAGDAKPYLLTDLANEMGARTRIRYTTSVKQYLEDKRQGRTWATRMFFPVQVVEHVERLEEATRSRYVSRYRHHDGYYDPRERQFRGFGYVESWDTEDVATHLTASGDGEAFGQLDADLYVPPVYTRTWYRTGAFVGEAATGLQYAEEYWKGDPDAASLPADRFAPPIESRDAETIRQAHVALAGSVLRQEVYGLDGSPAASNPYTVAQHSFDVRLVQPRAGQRYASFQTYERESLASEYDREPTDPRVGHEVALAVDAFGNVTRSCQVAYPRRQLLATGTYPEQRKLWATVREATYIDHVETGVEPYRWIGVAVQQRELELEGLSRPPGTFTFDELQLEVQEALDHQVAFGQPFTPGERQARLFSWSRSLYWDEAQSAPLSLGHISRRGLLHHDEQAVLSQSLLEEVFAGKGDPAELALTAGYRLSDGHWWNRGLIRYYLTGPDGFGLPRQTDGLFEGVPAESSLNPTTTVCYDGYRILPTAIVQYVKGVPDGLGGDGVESPLVLRVSAENDYHALLPWRVTDVNDNVTEVAIDPLGVVVVSTTYATKHGQPVGDAPLADYVRQPAPTFEDVLDDPRKYLQDAAAFYFYDLFARMQRGQPPSAVGIRRQDYVHAAPALADATVQVGITYSDGLGRVIENRLETQPGDVVLRDADGALCDSGGDRVRVDAAQRWIVSGRVTCNNKGKVTEQYLPYFSATPAYEPDAGLDGVVAPPAVLHYDPLGRQVRTDTPKGFFSKAVFSAWMVSAYDEDDTVLDSRYFQDFPADPTTPSAKAERAALDMAATFYNTPAIAVLDSRGRTVRSLANNLGPVVPGDFDAIVRGTDITPQQLWTKLVEDGYLRPDEGRPDVARVTDAVRPYDPAFQAEFGVQFAALADPLLALLKENGLTTLRRLDVSGRAIEEIDPRLLYSNVTTGTDHVNVTTVYDMAEGVLVTTSADAGTSWQLDDVRGNTIMNWDSRSFHVTRDFDRLGRLLRVAVAGGDRAGLPASRGLAAEPAIAEVLVYGETWPDAAQSNLNGHVHLHYDPAGLVMVGAYSLTGQATATTRQVRADYESQADWTPQAMADIALAPAFATAIRYDALDRCLQQTAPDGSVSTLSYNRSGQLVGATAALSGAPDAALDPRVVVDTIDYDANGQRARIRYGNATETAYGYEDTTLRLVSILTTGPQPALTGGDEPRVLQDIRYTFDPVGNVTHIENRSWEQAFCYQQPVVPASDYLYDAIYQLLSATGRQELTPAATAGPEQTMALCPPDPADRKALEEYIERYSYDDGGNLVALEHAAAQRSEEHFDVLADSNRLAGVPYDAGGNVKALGELRSLRWSYANTLAAAETPDAPGGAASEFYLYDGGGVRILRVSRRSTPAPGTLKTESTVFVGTYQATRIEEETAAGATTTMARRERLSVMDDRTRVCVVEREDAGAPTTPAEPAAAWSLRYQLDDNLGSVAWEVDQDGQPLNYQEYLPYGGNAFLASSDQAQAAAKEFRYSGKELDALTSLYYYGARYYVSSHGRWLSPDPLGTGGSGLNLYAFVEGNPTSKVDETGGVGWWASVGAHAVGALTTLAIGGGGGFTLGHGRGIASGIFMGVIAGTAGAVVGGVLVGATASAIATTAAYSALASIAGSVIGGTVGETSMRAVSGRQPRTIAAVGTLSSGLTGATLAGVIAQTIGGDLGPSALVTIAAGLGSAVLSSGSHLGFVQREDARLNAIPLHDFGSITPATPVPGVALPAGRLLLVMAPQAEAERRYTNSFPDDASGAFRLNPYAARGRRTNANYHLVAVHGFHGSVLVSTGRQGNLLRPMSIGRFAEYIRDALSTRQFRRDGIPIKFISCFGGSVSIAPNAQVLANATGRTVYAFAGPKSESHQGPWLRFRPE